ncbi:MAG: LVIVD repeat-containing protein [Solirubrobacteraceae bacterium]
MRVRRIVAPMALCLMACALTPVAASAATPTLVGSVSDPVNLSGATSVAISGNFAYSTAYYAGELTAVDISNPAHPTIAGHSVGPGVDPRARNVLNADTVAISGGYAYVVSKNANASHTSADNGTGNALSIFDIHTNPAVPVLVGTVRNPNTLFGAYGIAVQGNFAYVAAQGCLGGSQPCPTPAPGNDFAVIDVSNPANPTIVATVANPASNALLHADSVAISGNVAYVTASYSDSLTAIDISNSTSPAIVGTVADSQVLTSANDVVVQGNHAYIADETGSSTTPGRFTVVDVSDPAHMKTVGSVTDPALTFAYRVRLRGTQAFVSSSVENSVTIIDISNPASPTIVGRLIDAAHLFRTTGLDLAVSGRYLITSSPYLASESQTNYPPFPLQAGGPSATGSVSVVDLTGGGPGPVVGHIAPVISGLGESAHKWREHGPKKARHKPPRGTKFTFTLDQSATVTLTFMQTAKGRLVGGHCQAPRKGNRHHRACTRTVFAGKLSVTGHSGKNVVTFSGRVGRKLLKPGRYTLVVTATANGLTSAGRRVSFTIVAS